MCVPTDKASNNIAVVCKKFYIQKSLEELGSGQDSSNDDDDEETKTEETSETEAETEDEHEDENDETKDEDDEDEGEAEDEEREEIENDDRDEKTYVLVDKDLESIVKRHKRYMKSNLRLDEIPASLPFLYWIPKMHKKPFSKQRYIAASYSCTTKPLSAILTKCLKLIEKQHRFICQGYFRNHGVNPMWILTNLASFHNLLLC